jgi:hypothetical protein
MARHLLNQKIGNCFGRSLRDLRIYARQRAVLRHLSRPTRAASPAAGPPGNSDSSLLTLAKDVLALTKVNWNTTQFDQKLPAPIKAAREVGRILKHIEFGTALSPDFRRYT